MKALALALYICIITQAYLNEIDVNAEVNDYYFIEESGIQQWFGKKHLQKNQQLTIVNQAKPLIWGQSDRVILMLEANYAGQKCLSTRSVVFVVDSASPHTYISQLTLKRITKDCKVKRGTPSKVPIEINGRPIEARISRQFNDEVNILGMDFMKANNVLFSMKVNGSNRDKSVLLFKFDAWGQKQE